MHKTGMLKGLALLVMLAFTGASPGAAQGLPTEPGGGAQLETQEFQSWTLRCTPAAGERPRRCELMQSVSDPQDGEPVLVMVVVREGEQRQPLAWIVLPLGVLLPPGVGVSVDLAEAEWLPVRHCEPGGCLVPWDLSEADLRALRAGTELTVLAYDVDEQPVAIPLSLMGFTAGLAALP